MEFYTRDQIRFLIRDYCDRVCYEPKSLYVFFYTNHFSLDHTISISVDNISKRIKLSDRDLFMRSDFCKREVEQFIIDIVEEAKRERLILELSGIARYFD